MQTETYVPSHEQLMKLWEGMKKMKALAKQVADDMKALQEPDIETDPTDFDVNEEGQFDAEIALMVACKHRGVVYPELLMLCTEALEMPDGLQALLQLFVDLFGVKVVLGEKLLPFKKS